MSRWLTVVHLPNMALNHMSTNGCAYPHIVGAYPHLDTWAKPAEIRGFFELGDYSVYSISRRAPTSLRKSSFSAISRSIFSQPWSTVE